MTLTPDDISEMKSLATSLENLYGPYKTMCKRFEEIYFMDNKERPKGLSSIDDGDLKITISPAGRNNVTGLKRILDTGEIQIKVTSEEEGKADVIEKGLKAMMQHSNQRRLARVEKDQNLSAVMYGMSVLTVESVDDLITARTNGDGTDKEGVNRFVLRQLQELKKQTPFLIEADNPMQNYPEWGRYGQTGHLRVYAVRGNVLKETWGVTENIKADGKHTIRDYFHYDKRLVWADGVTEPLFADTWIEIGDENEVPQIPVFVSYGGGSSLWFEPERQLHPFLYAMAQGEWDKRETLFWTYLFTAIYMQGLPGPTLIKDPEDTSPVKIDYDQGVKIITAKGKMENINIIDSDVMQLKNLMDAANAGSTIRPEAFGAGADSGTFSGYVTSMNASRLPAEDPKEGIEKVYRDAFTYILKRIKAESIDNELIPPADIPDDVKVEVTLEPNLTQDDLRNAQILTSLKAANTNLSNEWLNTNILKIPNSEEMYRQKTKEDFRAAILQMVLQNQELMQPIIQQVMGGGQSSVGSNQSGGEQSGGEQSGGEQLGSEQSQPSAEEMMAMQQSQQVGSGGFDASAQPPGQPMPMGENLPQTGAMIPPDARKVRR